MDSFVCLGFGLVRFFGDVMSFFFCFVVKGTKILTALLSALFILRSSVHHSTMTELNQW